MTDLVTQAPRFSPTQAGELAAETFGLKPKGTPLALPSERDQNFFLEDQNGAGYVLKLANSLEDQSVLGMQNQAMQHVAARMTDGVPKVFPDRQGRDMSLVQDDSGTQHHIRLLSYLPGKPASRYRPHSPDLLQGLGRFFGELDSALAGFDHPAAHRDFHWDLKNAGRVTDELSELVTNPERRSLLDLFRGHFQKETLPHLADLPQSVIHGDGNDYNVLVAPEGRFEARVSGVIDFGDMVHSQVVNDLAIVCAYFMMGKKDPLTAARRITTGYNEARPLNAEEIRALFNLICMRLCASVCHSAHQFSLNPDNDYLRISEKPAWDLLEKLASVNPRYAHYLFRDACGLTPVPGSEKITAWLGARTPDFAPLLKKAPGAPKVVLDLSVGSPLIGAHKGFLDPASLTETIFKAIKEKWADWAVGPYDEPRLLYLNPEFEVQAEQAPEYRTIHLGLDLFAPEGQEVSAFMDGRVHGFQNNSGHLDYGPTIILEHKTDDGDVFYSLFGHLSRDSLDGLSPGLEIKKGESFARIGGTEVNGGWPPHLHFQLILDLLDETADFPGTARPGLRRLWTGLCPDPNLVLGWPDSCLERPGLEPSALLERRRQRLGRNLSVSYDRPLKIVRGVGPYLISDEGRPYLDGVNNVCHVGHCHPEVVAAGQKQMAVLNTNTRYLYDQLTEYADRLLAKFPPPLDVCFLVCSGSEANELALRLARTYTGRRNLITVDGAYHGNTQGLVDISPYKHDGPGGQGSPPWVKTAIMPDGYRGPYKGQGPDAGKFYAENVGRLISEFEAEGQGPAAFICESILGCGGQVVLPEAYLSQAFDQVRKAGGLCIADEVQVGFGRVGDHFWAFESQHVVPDIVTLGKPIGNGHPMAAVVTTSAIAQAFDNGMEYFNTFGGNPVSCAVGLAVLEVIEKEGLQQNAKKAGTRLLLGMEELKKRYPLIGEVRGLGLFVGAELVLDRETLEPAAAHASHICNRMKEHGILMSTDGPLHNVLKLKPPIVFDEKHADRLVETLDRILAEDALQV